jgi:hypothetical protein
MPPLSQFLHRRSLTFAILTLLLSFFAGSHGIGFGSHSSTPSSAFLFCAIVLFVVACAVGIHATANLVRDVDRGYSPGRCSLAAVVLLGAFAFLFLFGYGLISFIINVRTAA